ncbi:nucleotidyl transferase AbiEii/AbiGii toxin family protein [Hufsiella ginkgonis]|uniref:Nucleotidyl transferase AbiEii/AbiGii toxin family protein n=1 Tax=Hufsiella ginkgonis TaxID=2695274 RepID=A0A7K1Y026_9SPHI|nr:nucleotidyl transferase AbiEii/AbiGii toxin family protein [Hufsiella ginkgonis]MXV16542.1 hypothetical protein [Hufsiella ginkgonis]
MKAIAEHLLQTIHELQALPSLSASCLGGGTNFAIRYQHRVSVDIDLFFPDIIGKPGYERIKEEAIEFFGDNVLNFDYPCDVDDQYIFQRFYVRKGDELIKVEILQNMKFYEKPDLVDGIRLMTENDISVLKIVTACNRANEKDIYDLDYLTDRIALDKVIELLKEKEDRCSDPVHRSIFGLDDERSPIAEPDLLLKFEEPIKGKHARPGHSNPRVDVLPDQKNWMQARSSWRRKVRRYFDGIGRAFPAAQGF